MGANKDSGTKAANARHSNAHATAERSAEPSLNKRKHGRQTDLTHARVRSVLSARRSDYDVVSAAKVALSYVENALFCGQFATSLAPTYWRPGAWDTWVYSKRRRPETKERGSEAKRQSDDINPIKAERNGRPEMRKKRQKGKQTNQNIITRDTRRDTPEGARQRRRGQVAARQPHRRASESASYCRTRSGRSSHLPTRARREPWWAL